MISTFFVQKIKIIGNEHLFKLTVYKLESGAGPKWFKVYFIAAFSMTKIGPRPETESTGFPYKNYKIASSYKTEYKTTVFKFSFLIKTMVFVAAGRKISCRYPYIGT